MNLLSPRILQTLLCASHSVKTNLVMLYLARRDEHPYFRYLDQSSIETGTGKRQIVPGGWLEPDYQITVPPHLNRKESKMDLRDSYARQVRLLMAALPHVAKESCFALKGGTAINLFVQDFPRLSVDIDLAYKTYADRDTDLAAINDALMRITESLNGRPGITAIRQENKADEKRIIVNTSDAQIKIEVSPVWRGLLLPPTEMAVCEQVEIEYGFTTINVVSLCLFNIYIFGECN